MNSILTYLAASAVCASVLWGFYRLFLSRETFFAMNRFYLLAGSILMLILPLFPWHSFQLTEIAPITVVLDTLIVKPGGQADSSSATASGFPVWGCIYLGGLMFCLFRLTRQLLHLFSLARGRETRKEEGYRLVFAGKDVAPFSFFHFIFLPEGDRYQSCLSAITSHEKVHVRQLHTIDIMVAEILTIIQWFNPFAWLMAHELRKVHEYLADEGVLKTGISPRQYQQMILDESMGLRVNFLTHPFNVSLIKNRLIMMKKTKSGVWARGKYILVFPVVIALVFAASVQTRSIGNGSVQSPVTGHEPEFSSLSINQEKSSAKSSSKVYYTAPVSNISEQEKQVAKANPQESGKPYTVVEKMPSFSGGEEARAKFMQANIKYPEEAKKKGIQGTVFVSFIVKADGTVTNVKIQKGIGGGCDEESIRVVKLMPKWNPGLQKGKPVDVAFTLPIRFLLDSKKEEVKGDKAQDPGSK
jgi:TonB family protein